MSDHEQLHEAREREADELEQENERLGEHVEEAKAANQKLHKDESIPTPVPEPGEDGKGEDPPPEAEFPGKD